MKKLSAAVVVMLGLGVSAAQADEGSLNFTGQVTSSSCSVATNSTSLDVSFNGYSIATLNEVAPGTTKSALQKPFSIVLSGCPEGVSVAKVNFDARTSSYYPNVIIGNAQVPYIGFLITDADTGTDIVPKTFDANEKTIVAGENTLNYLVGLSKTATNSAGAGDFNIPVTFTMSYE